MRDEVRADALLASLEQEHRGKLKVFLGAAPGVGKTYAMLQAVREQAREGVDILIGVVETHGRQETLALLDKLAILPRTLHLHRQQRLEEMDLDGLLARKPAIAVVDELAHSNAPGSRHEKRWQDVEELLGAGIDVYTTLNVQHLESLNDLVWQLTGVRVKETLPDQVLLEADSLVLIDLPPKELLGRLKEGKVYVPHQAKAALQSFFSLNNLTALRELAMQTAASHVEGDLQLQWQAAGKTTLPLRGKLMVCIGDEHGAALVRYGHRFAQRRQLPWLVVHIDCRGQRSPRAGAGAGPRLPAGGQSADPLQPGRGRCPAGDRRTAAGLPIAARQIPQPALASIPGTAPAQTGAGIRDHTGGYREAQARPDPANGRPG